jgi:hypothetical protein
MNCTVCHKPDAIRVKERIAGSKGKTRNSFAQEYQLCPACVRRCVEIGALESLTKRKDVEVAVVLAKTYAWLKVQQRMGYTS